MAGKLTKPQLELLREVSKGGNAVEGYAPRARLLALGLVEVVPGKFYDRLQITKAGCDFLAGRLALSHHEET